MNSRRLPLIYILLGCVSLILGLILGLVFEPMWFARMGAVVVLFGAMSEYSLLKMEMAALYQQLEGETTSKKLAPSFWHQNKANVSHILVVIGTLVWGFGDLLL